MSRKIVIILLFLFASSSLLLGSQQNNINLEQIASSSNSIIAESKSVIWQNDCSNVSGWLRESDSSKIRLDGTQDDFNILSDGSAIYSDSIPYASGRWHGSLFLFELETPMYVGHGFNFEVVLNHPGSSNTMGGMEVGLYDQDKNISYWISIVDSWYSSSFSTDLAYGENGDNHIHTTPRTGPLLADYRVWHNSTTNTIQAQDNQGIYTLATETEFSPNREICYVGIMFWNVEANTYESNSVLDIIIEGTSVDDGIVTWHDDCTNTTSFDDLATWYGGAMGAIASTGGYLYATEYGSTSGSHGPVYYHTFQGLTIGDLNWLEAEIELDGTSALGAAAIMLYDSDYNRVAILDVADSWTGVDETASYAGWYDVDFNATYTPKEITDAVSEPYHETLRIEVNTTGIYGLIPRIGDFKMLDAGEVEWDRDITYLCVQFRTKDSYTTCQTMRIHDIKMQYVESGYSWHHDGSSINPFVNQQVQLNWYNLLNWANGSWASSGEYLYPQSIDVGSGWHGPTFVAELDQVHPLSQLSNFSVAVEAINDVASYCGKHTVYLADDDFDLILGVHINDAWNALQQGGVYGMHRFKNYTGTDNGPEAATSFTGINDSLSFRVEPDIGVYCYNPLYGETLLCEWDEAEFSRNVRYVILMSAQLESYPLMPFRVHDIMLEFSVPADDNNPPTIISATDVSFEYGTTNWNLGWNVTDLNPDYFWIMLGALTMDSGHWNGGTISLIFDGFELGDYNFTLIVKDSFDQFSMDSVIVTIEDTTSPTINHPADILISSGQTNVSIEWIPDDLKPDDYEIYLNGSLVSSGIWNSTGIVFNLDGLLPGLYEYQLIVYDSSGNSVSDIVNVIVQSESDNAFLIEFTLIISVGSFAVIIVVVVVIWRSKGQGPLGAVATGYNW